MTEPPRILVVDHRDSFVFILAEQFLRFGATVETYRSDLSVGELERRVAEFDPDLVVLSPGPGHPREATTTLAWLERDSTRPVLGVCLGHQAIGLVSGAKVERGAAPVHGRAGLVTLGDDPLLAGLRDPFPAARYHSLIVRDLPSELAAIAWLEEDGEEVVMAMRRIDRPWIGLQFHPESFLTPGGSELLARILREALERRGRSSEVASWQTSRS
ncbi:MAG: aminodeoxychorismate/anthranilate synthase component II [Planctomycetes bacterium]|nr:aminodeoxychorismate/anthranilate synthase component II [Planctomycetota bacterium]